MTPRLTCFALGAAIALSGCDKKEQPTTGAASSAARAAPSAPAKPEAPWYEGKWTGSYKTERQPMDAGKAGSISGWKTDDGSRASGTGKIEVVISADKSISGKSSGPLGELAATGEIEGETLRIQLVPVNVEAGAAMMMKGVVVAHRTAQGVEGTLNASSGDGEIVRKGSVELKKQAAP
jgi:hypothetical protein